MPRRHGCLRTAMTVDVQGCTNDLKDRMSEKGHPEHRRSLPSMAPRHTVHPEHKKADIIVGFII
ncbi:MAG: hypothetical protein HRT54_02380 [Colwellia sp.]|nr:hypothetical protein [Colwellia sp.]